MKRIISCLICLALLTALPAPVRAETVAISTAEEFLDFAQNCRLDSYSQNRNVVLENDIDLSGTEFSPVPVFSGNFDGQGHTISGFSYSGADTSVGLFRTVTENGVIRGLKLSAVVSPTGAGTQAGGLCGVNLGTIEACSVSGAITGIQDVGGIVGWNRGTLKDCENTADVSGTTRAGGITGRNDGTVTGCVNSGTINSGPNADAVDIGGVAGRSDGKMAGCSNTGTVGYPHTGYNVGGVAGLLSGFLNECQNSGDVYGRRDVGGIAGQLDPSIKTEYAASQLASLDSQLEVLTDSMNTLAGNLNDTLSGGSSQVSQVLEDTRAFTGNFRGNVDRLLDNTDWMTDAKGKILEISSAIGSLNSASDNPAYTEAVKRAQEILEQLRDASQENYTGLMEQLMKALAEIQEAMPDYSASAAGLTTALTLFSELTDIVGGGLNQTASGMQELFTGASDDLDRLIISAEGFLSGIPGMGDQLEQDVRGLTDALTLVRGTLSDMTEGSSNVTEDLSELVEGEAKGSLLSSVNYGKIAADYDAGGIAGTIDRDNVLNQESVSADSLSDILFTDSTTYVKATLYGCKNYGAVDTKYDNCGGITGYARYGAVVESQSAGDVTAGGDYAGGIGGRFHGVVLRSHSAGVIGGAAYVGGICGSATNLRDCVSIAEVNGTADHLGAIAGEVNGEMTGNSFVEADIGGVDGVDYAGKAEATTYEALTGGQNIPNILRDITVTFLAENRVIETRRVAYGEPAGELPEMPEREGFHWVWEDFQSDAVTHSQAVTGQYVLNAAVLSTGGEIPDYLAEGSFLPEHQLTVSAFDASSLTRETVLASGAAEVKGYEGSLKLHVKCEIDGILYLMDGSTLRETIYTRDGSYLVFELPNGGSFVLVPEPAGFPLKPVLLGAAGLLAAGAAVYYVRRKKKG